MPSSRFVNKKRANIYQPNYGNKLQGLAQSPDVLSKNVIKRRADGSDRHTVGPTSNQVGGIGTKIPIFLFYFSNEKKRKEIIIYISIKVINI